MPSRKESDLTPFLQRVFFNCRAWYRRKFPGRDLILTCTYRSVAEQNKCYQQGRTKPGRIITNIDGIKKKSMHNYRPSRAFDFAIMRNGKCVWDYRYFNSLWLFFREAKLTKKVSWGRDWTGTSFKDYPHIQEIL